jgi:Flp pilus assembly protein TadG
MQQPDCSDRSSVNLVKAPDATPARPRRDRESGQAMVEFALILFPLLILVVGVVQFGIGLNYWLDMNRLSNQGARWAVVNSYPGCSRTQPNTVSCGTTTSLQSYIACQRLPGALKPTVTISFPSGSTANKIGDPVKVEVSSPFTFRAIMNLGTITLKARATMRIEQDAVRYTAGSYTPTTCP